MFCSGIARTSRGIGRNKRDMDKNIERICWCPIKIYKLIMIFSFTPCTAQPSSRLCCFPDSPLRTIPGPLHSLWWWRWFDGNYLSSHVPMKEYNKMRRKIEWNVGCLKLCVCMDVWIEWNEESNGEKHISFTDK